MKRLLNKEINGTEASKQLGLSVRQTKNIKAKVLRLGPKGITHQNRGRPSNRKLSEERIETIERVVRAKYPDFGPTFASEKLLAIEQIKINKETLRQLMTRWGLWQAKSRKRNKEYRQWRARKERFGEMEQFDGSYFKWLEGRGPECCLLASIDDARGIITQVQFVRWEGVKSAFSFWKRYVETKGKPMSIYLDRHSTYKKNQKSVFDDPSCLTQFERAMTDLTVKVIHARSPQAKGRIERLFETLQDRLVKEMRLAGIETLEEADKFANEVFIPMFNQRFAVKAAKTGNLHRPLTRTESKGLEQIFSIHNKRVVGNDFTVRFAGVWYQLDKQQPTLVRPKDKIRVEERLDGTIYFSLNDKLLSFAALPERPQKIKIPLIALSRSKPAWRPPANHPWRRQLFFGKRQRSQVSTPSPVIPPEAL
ncbi:MAG: ISNCY family transposase [Candidatus Omnitrophota bacterium]|nr:ISNCY family transposase [Candidatus Omnitrophota bacterium]